MTTHSNVKEHATELLVLCDQCLSASKYLEQNIKNNVLSTQSIFWQEAQKQYSVEELFELTQTTLIPFLRSYHAQLLVYARKNEFVNWLEKIEGFVLDFKPVGLATHKFELLKHAFNFSKVHVLNHSKMVESMTETLSSYFSRAHSFTDQKSDELKEIFIVQMATCIEFYISESFLNFLFQEIWNSYENDDSLLTTYYEASNPLLLQEAVNQRKRQELAAYLNVGHQFGHKK